MNLLPRNSPIGIIQKTTASFFVGVAVMSVVCPSLRAQTVLLYDDFTGSPQGAVPVRTPQINETGIFVNNWVWQNGTTYLENAVISAVTGEAMGARLALDVPSVLTEVSISARLNTGISTPVNWVGVGFTAGTASNLWWLENGGGLIWGILTPTGDWSLMLNGTSTYLANGTYQGSLSSALSLSIQYDPLTTNAALLINGANVSGWFHTGISADSIGAVGFTDQAAPTSDPRSAYVDSFSVVAVPEPGAIYFFLLGAGILGLVRFSRRSDQCRTSR